MILARGSGDLLLRAMPASDGIGDPQVSWAIEGGGRRIIHGGDTLWHGHWWNIARAYGPFDCAFLPINGMRYRLGRFVGSDVPISLTPLQAVTAAKILGAKTVCPIHYGLFGNDSDYMEFPDAEAEFLREAERQGVRAQLVKPGDWLEWPQ